MEERNLITVPRAIRTENRDTDRGRDRGRGRNYFPIIKASKTLLLRILQNIPFICPLSLQMVYELIKHW